MKNENNNPKYAPVVAVICALTLFMSACCAFLVMTGIKPDLRDTVKENVNNFLYQEKDETEPSEEKPAENTTARLMCAGNNTIYRSIYSEAQTLGGQSGKNYDFAPIYEKIKGTISQADIAMINMSSVISSEIPVSSYPNFCSPTEAGDALYDLGFRVINHANKNVFDKDEQGALDTLSYWSSKPDAMVTGLYKNESDRNTVRVKEVNGIKISFVSFTDSVQTQLSAPSDINVISLGDRDRTQAEVYNIMKAMISESKEKSDIVVASMNFSGAAGEITEAQQQTIDYLVSFGADIIIGYGMNTIQPMEEVTRDDGTNAIVYYSLGNFISAEEKKENMLGAIADIVLEKNGESGEVTVKSAKAIPVVTYYERGFRNFAILPAENITDEDIASHSLNSYYGGLNASYISSAFDEAFSEKPDSAEEETSTAPTSSVQY